jgi:1-acyl-sn-glycerol-3-phosphate acyltransferase
MFWSWPVIAVLVAGGVLLWALFCHWMAVSGPTGTPGVGIAWRLFRLYARVVHRLRVEGLEHVPRDRGAGPLVVVANHTAGVDPVLIQAMCRFEIRWMMASGMQVSGLDWLWEAGQVIAVSGDGRDLTAAREAIRHVQAGGVLGIFPEGGLERPARRLRPFMPGVGLIVHKTRAPVLCAVIDGTPQVDPAWASLWRSSRSRVRFLPVVDYSASGMRPAEIAADLERRFAEATEWDVAEIDTGAA